MLPVQLQHVLDVLSRTQHLEVLEHEGAEGHVERELGLCRQLLAHRPEQLQLLSSLTPTVRSCALLTAASTLSSEGARRHLSRAALAGARSSSASSQQTAAGTSRAAGAAGAAGELGRLGRRGRRRRRRRAQPGGGDSGGGDDEGGGSGVGTGLLEAAHWLRHGHLQLAHARTAAPEIVERVEMDGSHAYGSCGVVRLVSLV